MRVLFVCLGNICRSPTAHAATREALIDEGIVDRVQLDSAGIGGWHVGGPPDPRMRAAAAKEGLTLEGPARQVSAGELDTWDLIVAMDHDNLAALQAMAPTDEVRQRMRLFREYDPDASASAVPDPYYGGAQGFADVVEICRAAGQGLAAALAAQLDGADHA